MTQSELLQIREACSGCGATRLLYVRVKGQPFCAKCQREKKLTPDPLGQVQKVRSTQQKEA